jgi:cell division septation protein DedD
MSEGEPGGMHLSDKQLVFVFMTATVAAVVVFLFGVFVGRGVREVKGPIPDNGMTASADVLPDAAGADAPPTDAAARQGGAGAGSDALSYPERLGKTPPVEQLKPAPAPVGDRPGDVAPPEVPAEPLADAPPPTASTPAAVAAPAPYTVQVAAVKSRNEADAITKQLKAKGYDAYVFVPDGGDRLGVFRVRIGAFKDKRQADMLAERLLRQDKRYKPWVTR